MVVIATVAQRYGDREKFCSCVQEGRRSIPGVRVWQGPPARRSYRLPKDEMASRRLRSLILIFLLFANDGSGHH